MFLVTMMSITIFIINALMLGMPLVPLGMAPNASIAVL